MILFETVLQDLRYGARALLRNAGFTAVSVFALALGIGVNTAVFTGYKAFIARSLDARDPGALVNFALRLQSGVTSNQFSYPDYLAYRDHLHSVSGVIVASTDQLRLTDAGTAILFLSIALLATWLPSRRAMRVDPIEALRYE